MFKIINDPKKDKGHYRFSGTPVVSFKTSLIYSNNEVDQMLKAIQQYTKTKPRDYCLTLENENGERVYAMDNISTEDISDMEAQGLSDEYIHNQHYFTLLIEGELPM